jgi:hypothetical protein
MCHNCTHWLRSRNPPPPPIPPIWVHIQGSYWSAKIDDISLLPPALNPAVSRVQAQHTSVLKWVSLEIYSTDKDLLGDRRTSLNA